jgi:hypothetical protein
MPKMMKPLSLAFLGALIAMSAAAQQANVVAACGSMAPFGALTAGGQSFPTVDTTGKLCLSGGTTTLGELAQLQAIITEFRAKQGEFDVRLKALEARK